MSQEAKTEVRKDLDRYKKLEAVALSEGGLEIIKGLKSDAVSAVEEICAKYRDMPEMELRTVAARLSERLSLLRIFIRAPKNKKLAKAELDKLLTEDPEEEL